MSIVSFVLFALAGSLAITAIWHAIRSNLVAVGDLHARIRNASFGDDVTVILREAMVDLDPIAQLRRGRPARHPVPKPVTHRLHQFAKARDAA